MLPIRDNIPPRSFPFVNYLVIALCTLTFLWQLSGGPETEQVRVEQYGMIPKRVLNPRADIVSTVEVPVRTPFGVETRVVEHQVAPPTIPPWSTLLTCIFLHGGWMHFLGNMWFLYLFGDNVEDRFGHFGYLIFYLAAGVAASLTHLVTNLNSTIPTIGASGAIAGVMGAYFIWYPHSKVLTLVPLGVFSQMVMLPAQIFLGMWFIMQVISGLSAFVALHAQGVAWWAHIGGFAAGAALAWFLGTSSVINPRNHETFPDSDRVRSYRIYPNRRDYPW